jgi:hypothetical protein
MVGLNAEVCEVCVCKNSHRMDSNSEETHQISEKRTNTSSRPESVVLLVEQHSSSFLTEATPAGWSCNLGKSRQETTLHQTPSTRRPFLSVDPTLNLHPRHIVPIESKDRRYRQCHLPLLLKSGAIRPGTHYPLHLLLADRPTIHLGDRDNPAAQRTQLLHHFSCNHRLRMKLVNHSSATLKLYSTI